MTSSMNRPRLLDLFCGAGGAAVGYARAGFEVVGVDIKPQPNYPFEFHQADALDFDLRGFDAIHASPPCQAYIQRNKNLVTKWPKLIEPVRERLVATGLPYVIENVPAAPLESTFTLCGTQFDLPLLRHRIFEANWPASVCAPPCNHWGTVAAGDFAAVYAFGGKGHRGRDEDGNKIRGAKSAPGPEWSVAMGIDWMTKREMAEAIPPAYTEFIGRQLLTHIESRRPAVVAVGARHTTNGGGRSNWCTPRDLFQRMDDRWRFTFDAFASHENALCGTYATAQGTFRDGVEIDSLDGLRQDWSGRRVFMNPPYTRGFIGAAVEKASSVKDEAQIIVALLPENRDTIWWRSFIKNQATVYSIGRVKFIDPVTGNPGGSPPGGSAVVIWTPDWLDR